MVVVSIEGGIQRAPRAAGIRGIRPHAIDKD